jgi:hypothetical protein
VGLAAEGYATDHDTDVEGDGKRRKKRKKRKPTAKIPLHAYARTLGRSVPSKRRTNTPYRSHYKQLVLDHMGDIPSATLAHNRDLDAADALVALSGGNLKCQKFVGRKLFF